MTNYPTNLTDNQRKVIEKFFSVQERKRKYSLRNFFDAINYLLKRVANGGCNPKIFLLTIPSSIISTNGRTKALLRNSSQDCTSLSEYCWDDRNARA